MALRELINSYRHWLPRLHYVCVRGQHRLAIIMDFRARCCSLARQIIESLVERATIFAKSHCLKFREPIYRFTQVNLQLSVQQRSREEHSWSWSMRHIKHSRCRQRVFGEISTIFLLGYSHWNGIRTCCLVKKSYILGIYFASTYRRAKNRSLRLKYCFNLLCCVI